MWPLLLHSLLSLRFILASLACITFGPHIDRSGSFSKLNSWKTTQIFHPSDSSVRRGKDTPGHETARPYCPHTFEPLKTDCVKYFCWAPWVKAESLHFSHSSIVWLKIHGVGLQRQNWKNCVILQILGFNCMTCTFCQCGAWVKSKALTILRVSYWGKSLQATTHLLHPSEWD